MCKRSRPKKLGTLVPSGSTRRMYLNPQGPRRTPGRVLEKKSIRKGVVVVVVKVYV
jgi:hypothetical protein